MTPVSYQEQTVIVAKFRRIASQHLAELRNEDGMSSNSTAYLVSNLREHRVKKVVKVYQVEVVCVGLRDSDEIVASPTKRFRFVEEVEEGLG